ncbi:receptor-like kinase, partial [Trifolium pratense]
MSMACCPDGRAIQMQITSNGKEFNATIKLVMFKSLIYTSLKPGSNYDLRINSQSQGNVEWLSNLSSLKNLDLSKVQNLNDSSHDTFKFLRKLPILEELDLSACSLSDLTSLIFPQMHNYSSNLQVIDLSTTPKLQ